MRWSLAVFFACCAVSGANVKATNIATNATVATVTNDSGSFEMPYLLPGVYTVTMEMAGLKKAVREGVQLRIGERVTLDFALSLGEPSAVWTADKNNFAPRFGFAYQLNQKTVVRGGYGIFYDVLGVDRTDVNQGGFNQGFM